MPGSTTATQFVNLIVAPRMAFAALRERPAIWIPLLAIVLSQAALLVWYYTVVDFDWLLDHMAEASAAGSPMLSAGEVRAQMEALPPTFFMVVGALGAALNPVIVFAVQALYFFIVSSVRNDGVTFERWFSLVVWCGVPMLFAALASALNVLFSPGAQIPPDRLNPFTFGSLLASLGAVDTLPPMLRALDPTTLWTLALLVIGYREWTGTPWSVAALIALAPLVVIVSALGYFFG